MAKNILEQCKIINKSSIEYCCNSYVTHVTSRTPHGQVKYRKFERYEEEGLVKVFLGFV